MKERDVLNVIRSFIDGTAKEWDWDDFISIPIKDDPFLENIRVKCSALRQEFPSVQRGQYCNDEGFKVLEEFIRMIEQKMKQNNQY